MRLLAAAVCAIALIGFGIDLTGIGHGTTIGIPITRDNRVGDLPPDSPGARAGLFSGDLVRFDRMTLYDRLAVTRPVAGKQVPIVVQRGSRVFTAFVKPVQLASWSWMRLVEWLLTFLYAALALLVALRAPPGRNRTVIVATLSSLAVAWSIGRISDAVPSVGVHFAGRVLADACIVGFLISAYLFVLWFPPRTTLLTNWLWRFGLPVQGLSAFLFAIGDVNASAHNPERIHLGGVFTFLASAVMIVAVVDAVFASPVSLRKRTIVAGSSLVVLALTNTAYTLTGLYGIYPPWLHYLDLLQWASGFGMSYAVLRHRLLDLNLVISRAAIFSVVSLALLAAFALLEWLFATVLEHTIGVAFSERGKTALAASLALLVGLSARSVHRVVEHRLNRLFFARRYRALEDLHRFALETDAITDASVLLELTLATMRRDLEAQFVALYTGSPESGYVAAGTTAADLPLHFDPNEEVVLRLRRWGEAFIVDNNVAHPLLHAYVAPMMLRGTLYGFAICGPKIDRTTYLPDERETIATLVHRVGIAYEWLTRSLAGSTAR